MKLDHNPFWIVNVTHGLTEAFNNQPVAAHSGFRSLLIQLIAVHFCIAVNVKTPFMQQLKSDSNQCRLLNFKPKSHLYEINQLLCKLVKFPTTVLLFFILCLGDMHVFCIAIEMQLAKWEARGNNMPTILKTITFHMRISKSSDLCYGLVFFVLGDPQAFLQALTEKLIKSRAVNMDPPSHFDKTNIDAVFGMMDPTRKGTITFEQYESGTKETVRICSSIIPWKL